MKNKIYATMPNGQSKVFSFRSASNDLLVRDENSSDVLFYNDDGTVTTGNLQLDDVNVIAEKPLWKRLLDDSQILYASIGNIFGDGFLTPYGNLLSPALLVGAIARANSWLDYWNNIGRGNAGVVSDNFALKYPWLSSGTNLVFDIVAPTTALKGVNYFKTAINKSLPISDIYYLSKLAHNTGTGLTNPYIRKNLVKALQDPTLSRKFYTQMGSKELYGFTTELMKSLYPRLVKLKDTYGYSPNLSIPLLADNTLNMLEERMPIVLKLAQFAKQQLSEILQFNTILGNIAKESPQYLLQIYNDMINGKITNIEDYVRDLVKQSGTFKRRMNLPEYSEEAFSTIKGSKNRNTYTMDVGNDLVVDSPEMRYGDNTAIYIPKLDLLGDVSTWWSLRFPKFKDTSIKINTRGMHSDAPEITKLGLYEKMGKVEIPKGYLSWVMSQFPKDYGTTYAHTVFKSPNKGASIADAFEVIPFTGLKNIKYSLGYKKGGRLIPKHTEGGNMAVEATLLNTLNLKSDYIKDLDAWIARNPVYKGISTKLFRDFFINLVGSESSYNRNARSNAGYKGWYLVKNPSGDLHSGAFDHLLHIFRENITKYDLDVAKKRGIRQSQLLLKYWNLGNNVTHWLHNGVDKVIGNNPPISQYGENNKVNLNYYNYVPNAITATSYKITDSKSLANYIRLFRGRGVDYSNRENYIKEINKKRYKELNKIFDEGKLLVGQIIYGE